MVRKLLRSARQAETSSTTLPVAVTAARKRAAIFQATNGRTGVLLGTGQKADATIVAADSARHRGNHASTGDDRDRPSSTNSSRSAISDNR